MKILLTIFLIFSIASSCKQSEVKQSFASTDSLVIHFKDEQSGTVTKTVQTAESKAIKRIVDFIDAKETQEFKCGYDGKMFFYNKEGQQIQEVDFKKNNDSCNHFTFLLNGKLVNTRMNDEAIDFFDALERGMPYY